MGKHFQESSSKGERGMSQSIDRRARGPGYQGAIWLPSFYRKVSSPPALTVSLLPRVAQFAEMSDIDVHLELPKSITLASVALRVQIRPFDDLFFSCTNEFAAVSGMVVRKPSSTPPRPFAMFLTL